MTGLRERLREMAERWSELVERYREAETEKAREGDKAEAAIMSMAWVVLDERRTELLAALAEPDETDPELVELRGRVENLALDLNDRHQRVWELERALRGLVEAAGEALRAWRTNDDDERYLTMTELLVAREAAKDVLDREPRQEKTNTEEP